MTLLKFIEKEPKIIMMEEMYERLEKEPERQWEYIKSQKSPVFSRFNVFLRDKFSCQYCGALKQSRDLTFDHVIPRSLG